MSHANDKELKEARNRPAEFAIAPESVAYAGGIYNIRVDRRFDNNSHLSEFVLTISGYAPDNQDMLDLERELLEHVGRRTGVHLTFPTP